MAGSDGQEPSARRGGQAVVLANDYFVGFYMNGQLKSQGKDLDPETLIRTCDAACFEVPPEVYDEVLNGNPYPAALQDFPLDRCQRLV